MKRIILAMALWGCGGDRAAQPSSDACSTTCDDRCVDLSNDVFNCGSCGRTCVIGRAEAACVEGECQLGSCETGFADCDANMANGCELEIACQAGDACQTSCGSQGTAGCANPCTPTCELPTESCNLIDDDCNGVCDEGAMARCRVGVHRAYGANGHYYTPDPNDATNQGYGIEALNYYHLYASQSADLQPFFRCSRSNGKPFYTTDTGCEMVPGAGILAQIGFIAPQQECGAVPLHRLYNPGAGANFYTVSDSEKDYAVTIGYQYEFVAGYVWLAP
jgi:hypothetical protein